MCNPDLRVPGLVLLLVAGLTLLPAAARPQNPGPSLPVTLVPGQAVTQSIWKRDLRLVFTGTTDEVITLRVTSQTAGLDPHVSLIDPEKAEEAADDDGGENGNSLIKDHVLKRTGEYTVVVGSDGKVQGRVEILLEKAAPPGDHV